MEGVPGTSTVPGGLLTVDAELLLPDLCPRAAAKPPAAAPPINAMIRNFLLPPPAAAGSALICAMFSFR